MRTAGLPLRGGGGIGGIIGKVSNTSSLQDDVKYQMLINHVNAKTYKYSRLRIAFCLLAVTGVRVSQLLPLTVSQLDTIWKTYKYKEKY